MQDEGEDCPFWSHANLANHSRLFFGSAQEMSENVWDETARRILIMREFILSHHNGSINQSFLDDNDDRSAEIPRGEWSAQDITEAGWDLGELRQVLRRLTRKLVRMAIHDNFDRAQEFENRDERNLPLQMTLEDLPDLCFSDDEDDEDDEASHHSDPIGENSDDEEFLADIDNFIGLRKPIFDRCFAFIQKGMPVTMLDVYEIGFAFDSRRVGPSPTSSQTG